MEFFDSHSHLFLPEFDTDRDLIIHQAISNGVSKIILPNIDVSTVKPMFAVCQNFPDNCFPAIGLHPTSVKIDYKEQLQFIEQNLAQNKVVAIGEIGIDLYWGKTYIKEQIEAFEYQLSIAYNLSLPVIIHCRESFEEIINVLKNNSSHLPTGVFHSFTGTQDQAKTIFDFGFKVGLNGVITYKNSNMADTIINIPLSKIVLETDSPYLTPVPFRGKRNNSSYLIYIAQKIAEIKSVELEKVAGITTKNALQLFKIQKFN